MGPVSPPQSTLWPSPLPATCIFHYILQWGPAERNAGSPEFLFLFNYLLSQWGSSQQWAPGVWQRQTCWLLGYWETPLALISEKKRERDEERDRRWERGKKKSVIEWYMQNEESGERKRSRKADGWKTFTLSVLLVYRECSGSFLLPLLPSVLSPSCYLSAQNTED